MNSKKIINEPLHKHWNIPMSEWIERVPNELEVDAVGLWQIIPVGRGGFDLAGESLNDFVRKCLLVLFDRGALPVVAYQGGMPGWKLEKKYGDQPKEMAEAIIQAWRSFGKDPEIWDSLWFTLPDDIQYK